MYGWRGPSCNYVAAAMYRTEAAVGNRLNYHSCISTADQWPPNHRDIQPMKIKDMNFGREDFCHGGEKKRSCVSTLKKKYNSLNGQEDMKILALNDFAEGLKDVCPESFQQILLNSRLMKFLKVFALFTTGLVDHRLMLRNFFCKFVSRHVKRKISKIELLTRGQNNNKLWYDYRKGVMTASKAHSNLTNMNKILKPTGGCVTMWLLCQNISGLLLTNPDLHALKHDRTMEMEATNAFF